VSKRVWRKVVDSESFSPTNNPHPGYDCTLWIELECGHGQRRKMSQGIPQKAICLECEETHPKGVLW